MPDARRIFCVSIPFIATLVALIVLLVATLGGKHVPQVFLFQVNLTDLSINPSGVSGILDNLESTQPSSDLLNSLNSLVSSRDILRDILGGDSSSSSSSSNITAGDLGLANFYQVNLWGVCSGATVSTTDCTTPKWDWASQMLNTTWLDSIGASLGVNIKLPTEIVDGIKAFNASIRWMQIIFVAALALLGLELVFGFFSSCSRLWSCLAYIAAGIATTVSTAAAIFATAVAATIVGLIKTSAELYGADADIGPKFLSLVWVAVAFAIAASLFWCFSACCCANSNRRESGTRFSDKGYSSRSYAPINNSARSSYVPPMQQPSMSHVPYSHGTGRVDAYEPYSHRV